MLVTGVCSWDLKALRWLHTLRSVGYTGQIALFITGQPPVELMRRCVEAYGANIASMSVPEDAWRQQGGARLCWRWQPIYKLAVDNPTETIVMTDVWDLVWQANPEKTPLDTLKDDEVAISDEGITFGTDPTGVNQGWMEATKQFSAESYAALPANWKERPVLNGGVVAAKGTRMAQVARSIGDWTYRTLNDQTELNRLFWANPDIKPVFTRELSVCLNSQPVEVKHGKIVYKDGAAPAAIHANGDSVKPIIEAISPWENYTYIEKRIMRGQTGAELFRPTLSIEIPTCNRHTTTLPLTLQSILKSTVAADAVVVYDDAPVEKLPHTYQYMIAEMDLKGINFNMVKGLGKGQVASHEHARQNLKSDLIMRLDDDCQLEPDTLATLIKTFEAGTGAVSCTIMDPTTAQSMPAFLSSEIQDVKWSPNRQWFNDPKPRIYPVEHLYSCFIYRRIAAMAPYCARLSRVGHREETMFSHSILLQGWRLWVNTNAKIWHYRFPDGGIRIETNPALWSADEVVFNEEMAYRGVKFRDLLPVSSAHGLGDQYAVLQVLPEIEAANKDKLIVVGATCPELFKREGREAVVVDNQGLQALIGPQKYNELSIYNFMAKHNWSGHITDAIRALYGLKAEESKAEEAK